MNTTATKLFYIPATRTKTVTNIQDVFMVNVWLLTRWIGRCTNWKVSDAYILDHRVPLCLG